MQNCPICCAHLFYQTHGPVGIFCGFTRRCTGMRTKLLGGISMSFPEGTVGLVLKAADTQTPG